MKKYKKGIIVGAIILGALLIVTFLFAPGANQLTQGSSHSRNPDGYGAWYQYASKQGLVVKRWQKNFEKLAKSYPKGTTLIRVYPSLISNNIYSPEKTWIEKGNTLIILGVTQPVTPAPFTTQQSSDVGIVKIETTRRYEYYTRNKLLEDKYGQIVWSENMPAGKVIYSTTPYLAANAYQNSIGNLAFLTSLIKPEETPNIFIDEYIHGYKDRDVIAEELGEDVINYILQTPLSIIFLQAIILLVILLWAYNQRFGAPLSLTTPTRDNILIYIEALSKVLYKAESHQFVGETLGKENKKRLQQSLGLGNNLLNHQELLNAYKQAGGNVKDLEIVLQIPKTKLALLTWLGNWQEVHRKVKALPLTSEYTLPRS